MEGKLSARARRALLSLIVCWLIIVPRPASADEDGSLNLHSANLLFEYVGQVANGNPMPAFSKQYGNLQGVTGVDPSTTLNFYTEATITKTVSNGPLRIIDRVGITTIYVAPALGDLTPQISSKRRWDIIAEVPALLVV